MHNPAAHCQARTQTKKLIRDIIFRKCSRASHENHWRLVLWISCYSDVMVLTTNRKQTVFDTYMHVIMCLPVRCGLQQTRTLSLMLGIPEYEEHNSDDMVTSGSILTHLHPDAHWTFVLRFRLFDCVIYFPCTCAMTTCDME